MTGQRSHVVPHTIKAVAGNTSRVDLHPPGGRRVSSLLTAAAVCLQLPSPVAPFQPLCLYLPPVPTTPQARSPTAALWPPSRRATPPWSPAWMMSGWSSRWVGGAGCFTLGRALSHQPKDAAVQQWSSPAAEQRSSQHSVSEWSHVLAAASTAC